MVKITAVKFENGNKHEHIVKYKWLQTSDNKTGVATKEQMIEYVNDNPHTVFVDDKKNQVEVIVIKDTPKYLRTIADGILTDNLLYLPTFI